MGQKSSCLLLKQDQLSTLFTCEICLEEIPRTSKFKNKKCSHPLCKNCIAIYVEAKLEDKSAKVIKCPHLNCNKSLDPLACRLIVSSETFVRWCDALCELMVLGRSTTYCPNNKCSALILDERRCLGEKKSMCPSCKWVFCFQCKEQWSQHLGFQCGHQLDQNDVLFWRLIERKRWQRCPTCNQAVELASGCSNIYCRCGFHFCYWCGCKSNGVFHTCYRPKKVSSIHTIAIDPKRKHVGELAH